MPKAISIAALVTMMALAPAYSAERPKECTDAHMEQMDAMIAKMTDAAKKKEATTALDMSKAEMKKGNMEGCMKYMKQAHTAMGLH
jgi:CRISPR/Cas system CSM-associated protein Csm2 small subunit